MDIYRTEEEQIIAIKDWWKKNGSAIVWGVILSLVIITGWRMYMEKSTQASETAFSGFITVSEAFDGAKNAELNSLEDTSVQTEVEKLLQDHGDHLYGHLSALLLTKHHVNFQRWNAATEVLDQALTRKPTESIRVLMKSRLARIYVQQGKYEDAMSLLGTETNLHDFSSIYETLRGDIYYYQKKYDKAREAYQRALDEGKGNQSLLQMKLDDLTVEAS